MALLGTPECLKGVSSLSAYRAYGQTTALVPGMVYEGEPTLLAGAAGCSKTTIAMQISAALTDPTGSIQLPWGARDNEEQEGGIVVYLDFEKRGKLSEERARSMGLEMRNVKWLESPMLADDRGHLYNVSAPPVEKLERLVGILRGFACEGAVKLIVLDSWRYLVNTFLGYNENSFVDCTLVWDAVRAVCKEENCAMLVIAHFKKLDTRDRAYKSSMTSSLTLLSYPHIDFNDVRRTKNDEKLSLVDIVKVITKTQNPRKTLMDMGKFYPDIMKKYCSRYKFEGQGQTDTLVVCLSDLHHILEIILAHARVPIETKRKILNRPWVPLQAYTEVEIHAKIQKAFATFMSVVQYRVGRYRIDLYFPEQKVAVECDENGHAHYCAGSESVRQSAITNSLKCTWVRYDPYDHNFDIFVLIGNITQQLVRSSKHKDDSCVLQYAMNRGDVEDRSHEMIDEYCDMGCRKLELTEAEVRVAEAAVEKEREKSRQIELEGLLEKERTEQMQLERSNDIEKEKTKQIEAVEKMKQSDNEARVAEARTRQMELELTFKRLEYDQLMIPSQTALIGFTGTVSPTDVQRQPENQAPIPLSPPPPNNREIVPRPARRREPNVPTDVREYPFQPFIDRYLEPETDMTKGLQWSALKTPLREWHSREFPIEPRLNVCLPKAILDYFSSKLGGWHDTNRGGVKVKGFFGWRLRENPLPTPFNEDNTAMDTVTADNVTQEPVQDPDPVQDPEPETPIRREANHLHTIPPGGSAVERAELDIVRILNGITSTNRELGWETILARRNPAINDRAMTRGRKRLVDSGRVFKRAVLGNSCVYSLIQ